MELKDFLKMETKGTKTYFCPYCESNFNQLIFWQDHVRMHTGQKPFKHPESGSAGTSSLMAKSPTPQEQVMDWKVKTERNQAKILPNRITADVITGAIKSNDEMFPVIKSLLTCSRCNFCCFDSSKLMNHIHGRKEGSPYQCLLCTFKSCSASGLIQHLDWVHLSVEMNTSSIPRKEMGEKTLINTSLPAEQVKIKCLHKCDHCGKVFPQKSRLLQHIRFHTGERHFKCSYCSYRAYSNYHLRRHLETRRGSTLKCSRCNSKFCNEFLRKNHSKVCQPVLQLHKTEIPVRRSAPSRNQIAKVGPRRLKKTVPEEREDGMKKMQK